MDEWELKFGDNYTDRHLIDVVKMNADYKTKYGVNRSDLNTLFLLDIPTDISILEVGANIGLQLALLKERFISWKLVGLEKNKSAIKRAIVDHITYGDALEIPYADETFDMVFTSGLLIHIEPKNLNRAIEEIIRCSKKYVWGFEYYAQECEEVIYRGIKNMLWRNNFSSLYERLGLKLLKEIHLKYLNADRWDTMFLMEKQ